MPQRVWLRRWAKFQALGLSAAILAACGTSTTEDRTLALATVPPTATATTLPTDVPTTATTAPTAAATSQPSVPPKTITIEPTASPTFTTEQAELERRFRAAVSDAEIAEASEISDQLTIIDANNSNLMRDEATGRVLVATWTSWNGYDALVGQETTTTRETWVSVVPEMQNFCKAYTATADVPLTLRLEQLLGLPANNGKNRIVHLWVPSEDLFRPSPDPEITDNVAQLEMPEASAFPSQQDYEFSRDWFNLQRSLSYDAKNGYPWTRLGYTYDWGNPQSEVGLSEFVVWAKTTVKVESVTQNEAYCQP
ncbi:hypothetical protein ACP8Y2_20300 [Herpetosiphon llansteffanensis]